VILSEYPKLLLLGYVYVLPFKSLFPLCISLYTLRGSLQYNNKYYSSIFFIARRRLCYPFPPMEPSRRLPRLLPPLPPVKLPPSSSLRPYQHPRRLKLLLSPNLLGHVAAALSSSHGRTRAPVAPQPFGSLPAAETLAQLWRGVALLAPCRGRSNGDVSL
jgi:hypothetical protein